MSTENKPQEKSQPERLSFGQMLERPDQIPGQIVAGTRGIADEIQFKLGLKERDSALSLALEKGISPEKLEALGSYKEKPDKGYRNQLKWAGVAVLAAATVAVAGENMQPYVSDIHLGEFTQEFFQSIARDAGYTLQGDTPDEIVKGLGLYGVKATAILFGAVVVVNALRDRLASSDRRRRVYEMSQKVDEKRNKGELNLHMNDGFVAIDLGSNGDIVGRTLGQRRGWGASTLPILDGDENHSGYDVWAKIPNPKDGVEKIDFFKALDRIQFEKCSTYVLCPVNSNQAFIPDINDPSHFDLRFDEIVDKIRLLDEYSDLKGIPKKKIVVIGDKTMQRSVRASVDRDSTKVKTITLGDALKDLGNDRGYEILLADPTEIAMDLLASDEFNPSDLPVRFYEDPTVESGHGVRFAHRVESRNQEIIESGDFKRRKIRLSKAGDNGEVLSVAYGIDDIATRETISMLDPVNTVAIITDHARSVEKPYNSLVIADAVTDLIFVK